MSKHAYWVVAGMFSVMGMGCAMDDAMPEDANVEATAEPLIVACGSTVRTTSPTSDGGYGTSAASAIANAEFNAMRGCNGYHWFDLSTYNSCSSSACTLSGRRSCAITSPGAVVSTYRDVTGQLQYYARATATLTTVMSCSGIPGPQASPTNLYAR